MGRGSFGWIVLGIGISAGGWVGAAVADEGPAPSAVPAPQPTNQPPTAQVMDELKRLKQPPPVIAPIGRAEVKQVPSRVGVPASRLAMDRSVIGTSPGQMSPLLRREGEFIIGRRGRLIRSDDSVYVMFMFEADSKQTPELPMIVQACRLRETMEDVVQERGDSVVFVLSGEIHTYRGANYLLPRVMKIAVDHGNLEN